MFIVSWIELLPVSMMPTPSNMALLVPAPPSRAGLVPPLLLIPGAMAASALNVRSKIGRFWTSSGMMVKERSPLCS